MIQLFLKWAPTMGMIGFIFSSGMAIMRAQKGYSSRWYVAAWSCLAFMALSVFLLVMSHI